MEAPSPFRACGTGLLSMPSPKHDAGALESLYPVSEPGQLAKLRLEFPCVSRAKGDVNTSLLIWSVGYMKPQKHKKASSNVSEEYLEALDDGPSKCAQKSSRQQPAKT